MKNKNNPPEAGQVSANKKQFTFFKSPTTVIAILATLMVVFFVISEGSAQTLGGRINSGLNYATIVGWAQFDLRVAIMRVIQVFMGFLGVLAVVMILYGGFIWMTSMGDPDKVRRAKQTIGNAAIGLFLILAAFTIVSFIIQSLISAVGPLGGGAPPAPPHLPVCVNCGELGGGIIESVYPAPGARDVARNTSIFVTFKEAMDPGTIISGGNPHANIKFTFINPKTRKEEEIDNSKIKAFADAGNRTFTFIPDNYLGDDKNKIWHTVDLGKGIRKGADLDGDGANDPAFPSLNGHFSWGFEVGTRLDLEPPKIKNVFPMPDNTSDDYAEVFAKAAKINFEIKSTAVETPRDAAVSVVTTLNPPGGPPHGTIVGEYTGEKDVRICITTGLTEFTVVARQRVAPNDCTTAVVPLGCLIAKPRIAESVSIGCGLTINFDDMAAPPMPVRPINGNSFSFTVDRKIVGDTLQVASVIYKFVDTALGTEKADEISLNGAVGLGGIATRIANKVNTEAEIPDVTAVNAGAIVTFTAAIPGFEGNKIRLFASSNQSGNWSDPWGNFNLQGGEDYNNNRLCSLKCTDKTFVGVCAAIGADCNAGKCANACDEPRNAIIKFNFNEAMLPPQVAGVVVTDNATINPGAGSFAAGDFQRLEVYADLDNSNTFDAAEHIAGTFVLSNQYQTVEFIPKIACGVCSDTKAPCMLNNECASNLCQQVRNSCGDLMYCLPVKGNSTKYHVVAKAAELETCLLAGGTCSYPTFTKCNAIDGRNICQTDAAPIKNYPRADMTAGLPDGATDAAVNSLDGNRDSIARGRPAPAFNPEFLENDGNTAKGDTFVWEFWVGNFLDMSPPTIINPINPNVKNPPDIVETSRVPEMIFSKLLLSFSLKPDNHYREGRCECAVAADCKPNEECVAGFNVCRLKAEIKDQSETFCLVDSECKKKPAGNEFYKCINQQHVTLIENGNPNVLSVGYYIASDDKDYFPIDNFAERTFGYLLHANLFPEDTNFSIDVGSGVKDIYQNCFLPSSGPNAAGGTCSGSPNCCEGNPSGLLCKPEL